MNRRSEDSKGRWWEVQSLRWSVGCVGDLDGARFAITEVE